VEHPPPVSLSFPSCTWEPIFYPSPAWAAVLKKQEDAFTGFGRAKLCTCWVPKLLGLLPKSAWGWLFFMANIMLRSGNKLINYW
jgi:hypothetical protein